MSFLDNLENNLKVLESADEGAGLEQQNRQREAQRRQALAAAPYAEELKSGTYTAELLKQATRASYRLRTKVHMAWIGTTLRLEARDRRLELRPKADGVTAVFIENNSDVRSMPIDLSGNPETLVQEWLG